MKNPIKRREALRRTAWIMGGALTAPTIAGILNGCTPNPELTWEPAFFSEDQARLVMEMAEAILPETDTPGAKALGVPGFIEEMISLCYNPAERTRFMEGLEAFDKECRTGYGDAFFAISKNDQLALLNKFNDEVKKAVGVRGSYGRMSGEAGFFRRMKELTVVGYYTTEYGATQELQYQAVPVEYKSCIPLEEAGNGKTWAT